MNVSEKLVWLAHEIGRETLQLVVPGEGSVSVRGDDGTMMVSEAGALLSRISPGDLALCELSKLEAMFEMPLHDANASYLRSTLRDPSRNPPGIDAVLHAWLLRLEGVNFVAQLNPIACLQVLCSPGGERFAEHRLFPSEVQAFGGSAVHVPYSDVGIQLAREVRSKVTMNQQRHKGVTPRLVLIQNTGIIAMGPTAESVLRTVFVAEKAAAVFVGSSRLGGPVFLSLQQVARLDAPEGSVPRSSLIRL